MSNVESIVQQLQSVNKPDQAEKKPVSSTRQKETNGVDFANSIKDFLQAVNVKQQVASEKVNDVLRGESEDFLGAMTSVEESRLSFQLMLEIRNKLMDSLKEIQRMQV